MSEPLIPTRSQEGLLALEIFYDDFNDVHFFVEDIDQENLYQTIFKRMFPELKIFKVFGLGGKQAVLAHKQNKSNDNSTPAAVYLVDKDFDDLLQKKIAKPNLFYLNWYCIENYFVEIEALHEMIIESEPKRNREFIEKKLDLATNIPSFLSALTPIFKLFFFSQLHQLPIQNCSNNIERFFCNKKRWHVDTKEVDKFAAEVINVAMQKNNSTLLIDPFSDPHVMNLDTLDSHRFVSGKHLCKIIYLYLKANFKLASISFDSFLYRLCKNAELTELKILAREIKVAIKDDLKKPVK